MSCLAILVAAAWFLGWKLTDACRDALREPPRWTRPRRNPHRCGEWDADVTRAGDGVVRCWECYRKEYKRATFCGESWPTPYEVFIDGPALQAVRGGDVKVVPAPLRRPAASCVSDGPV